MALLSDKDREFVRAKFEAELKGEVKAVLFTQRESGLTVPGLECPGCENTRQLLEEVTSLSPKLVLETLDFVAQADQAQALGVDKIPATVLHVGDGGRIRFFGVPSGYEFATLIEDILALSQREPGLSPATLEGLKEVTKPTHIQVFVTPTWPYCPRAARLAHKLAQASSLITADVVEVTEFPQLAQRYDVMAVPKTVINETVEFVGAVSEGRFLEEVLRAQG